jgi:Cu2+-exporting ATPase
MENRSVNIIKKTFPVTGMSCAACATSVGSTLKSTKGVKDADVNFATHTAWATFNPDEVSLEDLKTALQGVGYDAIMEEDNVAERQEEEQMKQKSQYGYFSGFKYGNCLRAERFQHFLPRILAAKRFGSSCLL